MVALRGGCSRLHRQKHSNALRDEADAEKGEADLLHQYTLGIAALGSMVRYVHGRTSENSAV